MGYIQATYLPRRFIKDDEIPEKYVVVDGSKVLVNLRDPETGVHNAVAVLIESASVARIFEQHFESLWRKAIPTRDAVSGFEEIVKSISSKLKEYAFTETEIQVYKSLLGTGANSIKNVISDLKWTDRKDAPNLKVLMKTLKKLTRREVIKRHPTLDLYLPTDPKTLLQIYR